jgi:exopolysaccharide biosynthesis polyprenyl glycosylphosphotransferase
MLRLEKVFQNDDKLFIYFSVILNTFSVLVSLYIFSILENNTIYELTETHLFKSSKYFNLAIIITPLFFIVCIFFTKKKRYELNFISFLKLIILPLIISIVITFSYFFVIKVNFDININFIYLIFLIIFNLFISKRLSNMFYLYLIESNIIQRNIMLIGDFIDIKKIILEKSDKINIYKCCIINDSTDENISAMRNEIKIPCFNKNEDVRSVLEYHSLGQIWILSNTINKTNILLETVLKFSVDILIIDLFSKNTFNDEQLINGKYLFKKFETSKFYGLSLLIKVLIDKIISIVGLIISSPIILISSIFIYFEDGFPILFTQNRTGWDGRRFKIYKLRSLKASTQAKTIQATQNDPRLLRVGKIIRRLSIDELPQLINVLQGDMSIVGPRPHMVEHDIMYSKLFSNFLRRHKANPGLTGWAQVNGLRGATLDPDLMKRRMEHDLWYLNNWSIWLDLYIILKTFYAIFNHKGD